MKALYGLYSDAESAQRAVDALRVASSELSFDAQQIIIVSGEPHEGYEFTDSHVTSSPYRWALLGAIAGGATGYLLTTLSQKSYPIFTGGMSLTPGWTNGIIVYELTMLGAILTTLAVLLIGARLPNFKGVISDPETGKGKILVGVLNPPENTRPELERRLQQAGAWQVKQLAGT
ncbi:MAG TPA: quinol:electron acceptor oxidoreductase subunit ActD [Acidobacteriaceae bacterium]|nr:quinol:electron acceptor oxidoreductase subunit ActD [Acidobacteriaceae bacterium]